MASRLLIAERDILTAKRSGRTVLPIPAGALVTALARDAAGAYGITLESQSASAPTAMVTTTAEPALALVPAVEPTHRIVALGADHGGFAMKEALKATVEAAGGIVLDLGTDSEAPVDYPDFAYAVARAVSLGEAWRGIVIDGAGIGSAMVAGKVPGVRPAVAYNEFTARNAREHNNANVLSLGSRTLGIGVAEALVKLFLTTDFAGGRHQARVDKIREVEARFLR